MWQFSVSALRRSNLVTPSGLSANHAKISASRSELVDQIDEEYEVVEVLLEGFVDRDGNDTISSTRRSCWRATASAPGGSTDARAMHISLVTTRLLHELLSINAFIVQNDAGLKSLWPMQQVSDTIEDLRDRFMDA